MQISLNIITPPDTCHYLAHQESITECDLIIEMSSEEYEQRLLAGWRHFGRQVFRPRCENCDECKSLRIPVKDYKPNRSQARNFKANHGRISLEIQEPASPMKSWIFMTDFMRKDHTPEIGPPRKMKMRFPLIARF